MKIRICSSILLLCLVMFLISNTTLAKLKDGHNKDLERVLFGSNSVSEEERAAADALEAAAYLTIDQFGNNGEKQITILKDYGVTPLPSISEIDISNKETNHHREYTHQGWDSKYRNIERNDNTTDEEWPKTWARRKKILEDTVEKVFNFNWWADIPLLGSMLPDYSQRCDSFCALVYYSHLLGDHEETTKMDQYNYLMPVGGKLNGKDIIHELLYHTSVLFEEDFQEYNYEQFESELSMINMKYYRLRKMTTDKLEQNTKLAEEVLSVMEKHIPTFLEKSDFFSERFAKKDAA